MRKTIRFFTFLFLTMCMCSSIVLAADFSDLHENHWAYEPIHEMVNKGILNGYPDGSFAPDNQITRAEFAKILVLTLNLKGGSTDVFDDVPESFWAHDYINIASNYLSGYRSNGKVMFFPNSAAVREDVAVAVVISAGLQDSDYKLSTLNAFSDKDEISENLKKYVAIAVENNLMRGNANGTFNPKGNLTRAEVSKLMMNTIDELEKIAVKDLEEDEKEYEEEELKELPDFEYDEDTATVDLGEDWEEYQFSYSNSKSKIGKIYTPSQRVLTRNNHKGSSGTEREYFGGNYLFVMYKGDTENYKVIRTQNVFANVEYDSDAATIDLGSDWQDYKYAYSYESTEWSSVYTPSQRVLEYDIFGDPDSKEQCNFCANYVFVFLAENQKAYMRIDVRDVNKNALPDFEYDEETATVDLGEDWEEYQFSYSNSKSKIGNIYIPSQRVLTRNNYSGGGGTERELFGGNYLFVMHKGDTENYKVIRTYDVFDNIEYDSESARIDLGTNWKDYKYAYSYQKTSWSNVYTPSQRKLEYDMYGNEDSKEQCNFCADYVFVFLKSNMKAYIRIDASDVNKNRFRDVEFNSSTGVLDLGEDWEDFVFCTSNTLNNSSVPQAKIYTPSQRELKRVKNLLSDATGPKSIPNRYVYIMFAKNTKIFTVIDAGEFDPFRNVEYNSSTGILDLGEDWKDFVFCTSDTLNDFSVPQAKIYTPSQRELKRVKNLSSSATGPKSIPKRYVYVMLKDDSEVFKVIDTGDYVAFNNKSYNYVALIENKVLCYIDNEYKWKVV